MKIQRCGGVLFQRPKLSLILVFLFFTAACSQLRAEGKSNPPNFGPNVVIFNPSMSADSMQQQIDKTYATQKQNEFGPERNALLFLPGNYRLNIPVGFYTQVVGLGASPDSVQITGNVHADATIPHNNATCVFWRSVENFSVIPTGGTMQWAVSQGVSMRRMHIVGDLVLHQHHGWASGGWMSDTVVDGNVNSGSQQQWISRNTTWKSWTGASWNMMFVGVTHPPEGEWPSPPYTVIPQTPVDRENPFVEVNAEGHYGVRVPALQRNTSGATWRTPSASGKWIPIEKFYLAHPGDTASTMNAELAHGKNLILTPGIYDLTTTISIPRANTVVLGLGFATLHPTHGTAAMTIADVDGVTVSGLLFDAGATQSPVLLQVGPQKSTVRHKENPIVLHDVFFRVGGVGAASTKVNLEINSNDTIIDHTWIWRADHGLGTGWTKNPSTNGLVVNGSNVTAYGLFVEHHQQYQVLWNGNAGRTYFYQSEIPYDPTTQADYTSTAKINGWASYKVANDVTNHQAWGLGVYSVFTYPEVTLTRAIESPNRPQVQFHHMVTKALGNHGGITHVINNTGAAATLHPSTAQQVTSYP